MSYSLFIFSIFSTVAILKNLNVKSVSSYFTFIVFYVISIYISVNS